MLKRISMIAISLLCLVLSAAASYYMGIVPERYIQAGEIEIISEESEESEESAESEKSEESSLYSESYEESEESQQESEEGSPFEPISEPIAESWETSSEESSEELSKMPSEGPVVERIKIMLDAGHRTGAGSRGAIAGFYEGNMTWKLHLLLKSELESYGFIVETTRQSGDEMLVGREKGETENERNLRDCVERGKKSVGYDIFISLHSNSTDSYPSIRRAVIIVPKDYDGETKKLACLLGKAISETMELTENGIKEGFKEGYQLYTRTEENGDEYYHVMKGASSVGCPMYFIVEHSFHSNPKSCEWLSDDDNLKRLASSEAKALADYYGYEKITE